VRLPPAINQVVEEHSKWLMRKLYDSREQTGDVVFVIKQQEEDIDIPIPGHLQAAKPENAEMRDESDQGGVRIKCHR